MKFDDLDKRMRAFETARDQTLTPETFIVARIDGRSFSRLTKEVMDFAKPFDERFRDMMIGTVEHLMNCGFAVRYGYTQSDEISLLFGREADPFARSVRKMLSILAGEASAAFTAQLGRPAAFDCRVIELPTESLVVDYFRWRSEDAHRNALNAWCYWTLREEGLSVAEATSRIDGLPVAEKNELLFRHGINFNELPMWQRRGTGVIWERFAKEGGNPRTGETTTAMRQRTARLTELPMRDAYSAFVRSLLSSDNADAS